MKHDRNTDDVFASDILEAIKMIETYVDGKIMEDFLTDTLLQDGVIRRLEIIG